MIAENGITFYYPRDMMRTTWKSRNFNLGVSLATPEAEEGEKFALTFDDGPADDEGTVDPLDRQESRRPFSRRRTCPFLS